MPALLSSAPPRQGGEILITVASDNRHTIYLWKWMTARDQFCKAVYIPGWCFGPDKKLGDLGAAGMFFKKPSPEEVGREAVKAELAAPRHPWLKEIVDPTKIMKPDAAEGYWTHHRAMEKDGTWELLALLPGFQGAFPLFCCCLPAAPPKSPRSLAPFCPRSPLDRRPSPSRTRLASPRPLPIARRPSSPCYHPQGPSQTLP